MLLLDLASTIAIVVENKPMSDGWPVCDFKTLGSSQVHDARVLAIQ